MPCGLRRSGREFRDEIYAAHNAYLERPNDENFWAMVEVSTDLDKTTTAPGFVQEHPTEAWRTEFTRYNANKYNSVLVLGHLMLDNVARMPTIGTPEEMPLLVGRLSKERGGPLDGIKGPAPAR